MRVFGGGRWTQLRKVRLIAALPAILNALQIAVPTAFLGAVLGEYMGGIDRGVGITLIRLQGDLDSVRVWTIFLMCAVVALVGYLLVGLLARLVTPWVSGRAVVSAARRSSAHRSGAVRRPIALHTLDRCSSCSRSGRRS